MLGEAPGGGLYNAGTAFDTRPVTPREARSRCQVRTDFPPGLGGGVQPSGTQSGWSQPTPPPQIFLFWQLELPCSFGLNNPICQNGPRQPPAGGFRTLQAVSVRFIVPGTASPSSCRMHVGLARCPATHSHQHLFVHLALRLREPGGEPETVSVIKWIRVRPLGFASSLPRPPQAMPTRPSELCFPQWGEQHRQGEGMSGAQNSAWHVVNP